MYRGDSMKIVNLDGYTTNPGDLSWEGIAQFGELTTYDRTPPEKVVERAKDAEILLINKTVINADMLMQMPKLRYVGLQSTGYNVIDGKAARELGITISNIPAYSTNAVAQLVFAFILQITNKVTLHSDAVHNNEWTNCPDFCFWKAPLTELAGKTIGIIGFGSIGLRVSEIAKAFGMSVMAYTPHPKPEKFTDIKFVSLDELLNNSDIITCHCPLTPETTGLINTENISKMKDGAILINTSRGPVIDDKAVAEALNSGKLTAAGIDVLTTEPPKADNPLLKAKNCFITPHIAWAGYETRARLISILEDNLRAFLEGHPQNVVN